MKTLQQIANIIGKHLFNQKEKCSDGGDCVYRLQKDGEVNRCAVGVLIPKRFYKEDMEGCPAVHLFELFAQTMVKCGIPDDERTVEFLASAQAIHDTHWNFRNTLFSKLCKDYDLKYNIDKKVNKSKKAGKPRSKVKNKVKR